MSVRIKCKSNGCLVLLKTKEKGSKNISEKKKENEGKLEGCKKEL